MNLNELYGRVDIGSLNKATTRTPYCDNDYVIQNAQINEANICCTDTDISFLDLVLDTTAGPIRLDLAIIGENENGNHYAEKGMRLLSDLMQVVGVKKFCDIAGKYIRVAFKVCNSSPIHIVGNILTDDWIDLKLYNNW